MTTPQRKRILVAGATGVIGRRLCRLLLQDGWEVTGTTRSESKAAALRAVGVVPIVVDVFDAAKLRDAVCRAQPLVVVHQLTDLPPALDPARMAQARIGNAHLREVGTRHLVAAAAAAGATRMIAQSIAFAYATGPLPYREEALLDLDSATAGLTARAIASLEQQVLHAPMDGVVLRYGKLYGPGTGFDLPPPGGALHVDAAARAAQLAVTRGAPGVYNVAESDGTVCSDKATTALNWDAGFRMDHASDAMTAKPVHDETP